ncbi:MAG TPA: hypothetical protein DCW90_23185 [Lachnospiraceae bacterium]|nr:radical SAM protein [uncultured Lachnoclostridium sp.]HAU88271.1 hypothetical protein [Lachnospiraceae bacterium]
MFHYIMFSSIIKESEDNYLIIDAYYSGKWESDKKSTIIYLELLDWLRKHKTRKIEKARESVYSICKEKYGYAEDETKAVLDFVKERKLPLTGIFAADRILSQIDSYEDNEILTNPTPIIEVTNKCNYKCRWCYVPNREEEEIMSLECINENLVQPFIKRGLISWCLSGGEPSMQLDRTLAVAKMIKDSSVKELGVVPEIYLLTNGFHLKENAKQYKEAGITSIQIALTSSDPAIEKYLRRAPEGVDSFQCAVDGIREAKKEGFVTEVNMVLQPKDENNVTNINTMIGLFDIMNDIGIDVMRIIPAVPTGQAKVNNITFSEADYQLIAENMKKIRKKELKNKKMIVDCPVDQPIGENNPVYCRAGTLFLYINYSGHVFPCNNLQANEAECWNTTIKETPIDTIWTKSPLLNDFRNCRTASLAEGCKGCQKRSECVGECRALCFAKYGTFDLKKKPEHCYRDDLDEKAN